MAYDDWVDTEPKRYGSKPYPTVLDDGEIYGWVGDGWYYMDENGMLVGGRHPSKNAARAYGQQVKKARAARRQGPP